MAEEKSFEDRVKNFLKEQGCWFVKYWAGTARNGKNYTKKGIPDLLVNLDGYFMAIELKATKGRPSKLQLYNLKQITKGNGIAILLYPKDFDKFKKFVELVRMGEHPVNLYEMEDFKFLKNWWDKIL